MTRLKAKARTIAALVQAAAVVALAVAFAIAAGSLIAMWWALAPVH